MYCGELEGLSEYYSYIRFINLAFIWFFVHIGHYLRMKDLATVVIHKHMAAKSQTQLTDFLQSSKDSILIFTEKGDMAFFNQSAKDLFKD